MTRPGADGAARCLDCGSVNLHEGPNDPPPWCCCADCGSCNVSAWDDDPNHPEGVDCHGEPLSSGERCGRGEHRAFSPAWERPPEGWLTFGSLVDHDGPREVSDETDEGGLPLWERPMPGWNPIPPEGGYTAADF